MIWRDTVKRTVYLMGAGATRGSIKHVVINKKRLKAPLNSDFFKVAKTFVKTKGVDSGLGGRLERLEKVFRDEIPFKKMPTMEEAFSLLFISKDFPKIFKSGSGRQRKSGYRKEIEDFLRLAVGILTSMEVNVRGASLYDRLVAHLGPEDCIASLNYDTLLDNALIRAGWSPERGYCIRGGVKKFDWKMTRPPENLRLQNVKLLKLHGSLNWYVKSSFDQLIDVFDHKPNKILISKPRIKEQKEYIRQIIPPIYGKIFAHSHWEDLWTDAFEALQKAEVLVVIGCSLVETDFHLLGFLGRLVFNRKEKNKFFENLIVVEPNRKIGNKWIQLLKGRYRTKETYASFEKFANTYLK